MTLLTLSEDMYHKQYIEPYSWNNLIQLAKFRENVCLFLGVSFTDPNLRRLMDVASTLKRDKRHLHYILVERPSRRQAAMVTYVLEAILMRAGGALFEDVEKGAKMRHRLSAMADHIAAIINASVERDFLSFGMHTIWVENFSIIPALLAQIRTGQITSD